LFYYNGKLSVFQLYVDKILIIAHPKHILNENGGSTMDMIALILAIVGCLNWGLVGIFGFDLVAWLFGGSGSLFSRLIYTVVGLSGLWCISFLFRRKAVMDDA
jgi:uncharacterized membrane protein YuzA (DUF378 family)